MRLVPAFTPDPDYIDRQLVADIADIAATRTAAQHHTGRRTADVRSTQPGSIPPAT